MNNIVFIVYIRCVLVFVEMELNNWKWF